MSKFIKVTELNSITIDNLVRNINVDYIIQVSSNVDYGSEDYEYTRVIKHILKPDEVRTEIGHRATTVTGSGSSIWLSDGRFIDAVESVDEVLELIRQAEVGVKND